MSLCQKAGGLLRETSNNLRENKSVIQIPNPKKPMREPILRTTSIVMIVTFFIGLITALILYCFETHSPIAWGQVCLILLGGTGVYYVVYKSRFLPQRIRTAIILLLPVMLIELYSVQLKIAGSLGISCLIILIIASLSRDLYLLLMIAVVTNIFFLFNLFFTTIGQQHIVLYIYNMVVFQIGWILLCALSFLSNKHIKEIILKTHEAEYAARVKSEFLANVSHEIRTPLNAIFGFTTFIQRQNLSHELQENVAAIKTASHTLLSLINDILDFSKIESGKYEIVPVTYELASLIEDTISMICIRIGSKPIHFFIDVDPQLPGHLIGDNVRIRQILTNLLSNATKYTKHGFVKLRVRGISSNGKLLFYFSVQDTGSGISEEDKCQLFETFRQFDVYKNRAIEGTGIGLSLTRRLVESLGGSISVESTYGEGSTFTVMLPQEIPEDVEPFVNIKIDPKMRVVVCEPNRDELEIWANILRSFQIDHILVASFSEFEFLLNADPNTRYFLDSRIFKLSGSKMMPLKKSITIIADRDEVFNSIVSIPILRRPIYALPLAARLADINISLQSEKMDGVFEQFVAPSARILVVDDNSVNLLVFAGLLEPYGCDVVSVESGHEAIKLAETEYFDLIFMDQMMPDIDGLGTMKLIRELTSRNLRCANEHVGKGENAFVQVDDSHFKNLPIIVSTANAISGMREEYLKGGFNDYIAKPIYPSHLNAILKQWIPLEKQLSPNYVQKQQAIAQQKSSPLNAEMLAKLDLPYLNIADGLRYVNSNCINYRNVLESFRLNAPKNLLSVRTFSQEERWKDLIIEVHAVKSLAKVIGAEQLSALAAELESAGKRESYDFIRKNIEKYLKTFQSVLNDIDVVMQLVAKPETSEENETELSPAELRDILTKGLTALEEYDADQASQILKQISLKLLTPEFAQVLKEVQVHIVQFDYKHAIQGIQNLLQHIENF
ncbi:MAG: response regulator [Planctomycetaceae bacterium]|nr:response regulator [Planctomycetaceae bacterium]